MIPRWLQIAWIIVGVCWVVVAVAWLIVLTRHP